MSLFGCTERPQKRATFLVEGRHWKLNPETGCWEWQLYKTPRGYGHCNGGWAHRVMWIQSGRSVEPGQHIHHKCENPSCINPDHLEALASSSHIAHHQRMFEPAVLDEIRELAARPDLRVKDIAVRVGLPRTSVQNILNGDRYAELGIGEIKPERACVWCGAPVEGRRRSARYCCPEHRIKFHSRKLVERRKRERAEARANA